MQSTNHKKIIKDKKINLHGCDSLLYNIKQKCIQSGYIVDNSDKKFEIKLEECNEEKDKEVDFVELVRKEDSVNEYEDVKEPEKENKQPIYHEELVKKKKESYEDKKED